MLRCCLIFMLMCGAGGAEAAPVMHEYASAYYHLHTDLPEIEAREAGLRMMAMVEEYQRRAGGFGGKFSGRMPVYFYSKLEDYLIAGGMKNSAGRYDGEKLMGVALRREDGVISLAAWHVMQHEAFHQFADHVIGAGGKGGELPMWANEGLAEYFGEGLFTGDGFEMGLVPLVRLARVQKMATTPAGAEGGFVSLAELVTIDRDTWNKSIDLRNYDQAWSLVHFLAHAESGRYQKVFDTFVTEVGKGGDAAKVYARTLGAVPELEKKWRAWWAAQGDSPTAEGYARATVAILASFAGRANASGQALASFDELIRTDPAKLQMPASQWLPASLFEAGVNQSLKMRTRGDTFVLGKTQEGTPVVQLTIRGGTKLVARALVKGGRVESVEVKVLERGK